MADNYLEKKFDEFFGLNASHKKVIIKKNNQSIDNLLLKNRSYRGYNNSYIVSEQELMDIVSVNTRIPSGMNQQCLRFKLVTSSEAQKVLKNIKLGAALPELNLPFPGEEPNAFIIICSEKEENRIVDIDLGISMQSMLLKAVDMGLNGIIVCAINKEELKKEFNLPNEPLALLAIGKGIEKIQLLSIKHGESQKYYRKQGIHYVPKLQLSDIII